MKTGREIRHALEYAAVRGALAMAGSLPLGIARAVGASVGGLAFALRIRRDVSVDNIARALGVTHADATRIARRCYGNLGRSMMEFAAFRRWSPEDVLAQVTVEGAGHLTAVRAVGRGAIVVASHFGSWEMGGAIIPALGHPTNFVIGEQSNRRVDEVTNKLRLRDNVRLIPRATALKKVLVALRDNEIVALLADQDARKGGVIVDFLGRPASTVRGPALFAIRAKCAIIPLSIHREGKRHRAIFDPPIWPNPAHDEETAVHELTSAFSDALSRRIRAHPDEYFWPHRRWKTAMQTAKTQAVEAGS